MSRRTYHSPTQSSVFPPVIKNLLILNGLFFFAQVSMNELLMSWLALWPLGIPDVAGYPSFWPWQIVSYAFLHGGLGHLFFNMFALWMFGIQIESTWGSRRFLTYYFICVIGAGLTQLLVVSMSPDIVPTVGASGGVFGILLAFGMMFPEQRIMLLFPPIPIKAKYFVIGYGLIELWSGISGTRAGVANFAHLGGMVIGYFVIQYWRGKLPVKPARTMRW